MQPPAPVDAPPPPTDASVLRRQADRVRRRKVLRAVVLAGILAGSGFAAWVLSSGDIPARSEWAFRMTHVEALQTRGLDGRGQVVCLVDTGIDPHHPDLASVPILAWRDLVHRNATPYDDDGHGTAMAGLLAARGALRGVASGVALIVAKVLDSKGRGTSAGLAAAIDFCTAPPGNGTTGATVISLSLGAATNLTVGSDVTASVDRALSFGIVVVASAGNDGLADNGDVQDPASIPGVIAVGAIDSFGAVAPFSSIGATAGRVDPNRKPEVVAPGVDLLTTARGGGYRLVSGTSASAAFVAGIAALLLQAHSRLSRSGTMDSILELKTALMLTAQKGPGQAVPHDSHSGYGVIDAAAADKILF